MIIFLVRKSAATVGAQTAETLAASGVQVTLIHRDLERPVVDRSVGPDLTTSTGEDVPGLLRAALGQDGPRLTPRGWRR